MGVGWRKERLRKDFPLGTYLKPKGYMIKLVNKRLTVFQDLTK
jgi:hypothetical protein